MDEHDRRNALPPLDERTLEYCVHGTFVLSEEDRGFVDTRWLDVDTILESIDKPILQAKVEAWRADEQRALTARLDPPDVTSPETI